MWEDRPERPNNPVIALDQQYAGIEYQEKLKSLRGELEKRNGHGFVVSMLDEIAWLYNLRGSECVTLALSISCGR